MRRFAALCLVSLVAFAEEGVKDVPAPVTPVAPTDLLFVQPTLGANLFNFSLSPFPPYGAATSVLPGVRVGSYLNKLAVAGSAGLGVSGTIPGGQVSTSLSLGVDVMPYLKSIEVTRFSLIAGAHGTLTLDLGRGGGAYPGVGLNLGGGVTHFFSDKLGFGAEAGLRPLLMFNGGRVEPSIGLYLSFTTSISIAKGKAPPPPPGESKVAIVTPPPASAFDPAQVAPPCSTWVTDGWMSPTQGVWQDDPTFEDKPRKQLTRRAGAGDPFYDAELGLVTGKPTLVFGVHHYRSSGSPVQVDSRDAIVLKGLTTCREPKPVKLELSVTEGWGLPRVLHDTGVIATIPLAGAMLPQPVPWEVTVPVRDGLPAAAPFTLAHAGPYTLTGELLEADGARTGLRVRVLGQSYDLQGPTISVVPVVLQNLGDKGAPEDLYLRMAEGLVKETAEYTPDLFPLAHGKLPVRLLGQRSFVDKEIPDTWLEFRRVDATVAALNESLAADAFLNNHGRVVVFLRKQDFEAVFGAGAAGMAVKSPVTPRNSASLSWKVMFVSNVEDWSTVAHEIVHTLPSGWAKEGMEAECGRAYHNLYDPVANGERITEGGEVRRERKAGMIALMGPAVSTSKIWVTQCTWWHLLEQFIAGPADPPVVLVRAWLGKQGNKVKGQLRPSYTIMGSADLAPGKGPWAIVVKDAAQKELGRFPIEPRFSDLERNVTRTVTSVAARLPLLPGMAELELVGPTGSLDKKVFSTEAPVVTIAPVAPLTKGQGTVRLSWTAKTQAGTSALSTVSYSTDHGKTWASQAFELGASELEVTLDPKATSHRVRVTVTDGSRSSYSELELAPSR